MADAPVKPEAMQARPRGRKGATQQQRGAARTAAMPGPGGLSSAYPRSMARSVATPIVERPRVTDEGA
ncbi:hypothetical protein MTO96_011130 [Rhipicephalus appendiculatus]